MLAASSPLPDSSPAGPSLGARVRLCGALVAEIDGRRVDPALPGRKGRLLFTCLVVGRHRPMSRDELIGIIWPDGSPADPDGTFSTLLTRLRNAVGHELVVGRSELTLELGDAWVDWEVARASVTEAEMWLATGDAPAARAVASAGLEIARRPLLPGVSTPWLEERRRELDELVTSLLETGGRAALGLGGQHLPAAERSARELIEREPYRESGYALLMETHAARGNVAEALRVYDDLRRLLREELGLTPAAPVTALAGRLLDQEDAPFAALEPAPAPAAVHIEPDGRPAAPLPPPLAAVATRPLAGRRRELTRLLTAVTETPADRYRVLALTGVAGVGKTHVAGAVAALAHDAGWEVLHGRVQRDGLTPFHPFVEALRRHLAHDDDVARRLFPVLGAELAQLARHVPELRSVVAAAPDDAVCDADVRRQRIFDAVGGLCEGVARRRPLLLVLEDLQWADPQALWLLRHVARATHGARVSILVTLRDDEPLGPDLRAVLLDLHRERALDHVALAELSEAETAELVSAHRGRPAEPGELRGIHERTGGNPFLVEELLRELESPAALHGRWAAFDGHPLLGAGEPHR